jgi:hypothetical protein
MLVRITEPGQYDHHDQVVRFDARIDGKAVRVLIGGGGLLAIRESLNLPTSDPLQIYQLSGTLLPAIVKLLYGEGGADPSRPYYIDFHDVTRVTGTVEGPNSASTPKPWAR